MYFDARWIIMTLVNVFAIHLFGMFNDLLAPWSIYLLLEGALLVIPVFYLGIWGSVGCALITAIAWEGAHPGISPGGAVTGFLIINLILWLYRDRFQRERVLQVALLALLANGAWIGYMAFAQGGGSLLYWGRIFIDGLLSQCVVGFVVYWLHLVQRSCLRVTRMSLHTEGYS